MKYYLINNTIMKGGEIPKKENYAILSIFYLEDVKFWQDTLQPCEISERELTRIRIELGDFKESEILDVTDIVEEKSNCCGRCDGHNDECDGKNMIYFKQPKQVDGEIEAVELYDELEAAFIYSRNYPETNIKRFREIIAENYHKQQIFKNR